MNHYELLGIKEAYNLDKSQLKSQYLKKQMEFHPDRAADPNNKIECIEKTMQINEAYKTLKDKFLRAEYLLNKQGMDLESEESKKALPFDVLEEIIALHEEVNETSDLNRLQQMLISKENDQQQIATELEKLFLNKNYKKALEVTVRFKYIVNLAKNIKQKIKHADSRN